MNQTLRVALLLLGTLAIPVLTHGQEPELTEQNAPPVFQAEAVDGADMNWLQTPTNDSISHNNGYWIAPTATQLEPADTQAVFPTAPTVHLDVAQSAENGEDDDVVFGDWLGYNAAESDTTWLTGNGDRLGIFSMESYPTLDLDSDSSLTMGTGFHFVNGPTFTDLPPRLFDLQLAYHSRKIRTDRFILDYRLSVGVFSDFEGSARKGVRFPGHVVSYYEVHPWLLTVFGAESLDRDDVSVLPVAGIVWRPNDDVVCELVFPRPKLQTRISDERSVYIAGELGGGTWAIERDNQTNDNATYRDFRLLLGLVNLEDTDSSIEIGWSFGRKLSYRSGFGDYHPDDTLLIRLRSFY